MRKFVFRIDCSSNSQEFFPKEAAGGGAQEGGDWPSSDSEDDDYDPEDSKESPVVAAGVETQVGIDFDWPSTDSEDDDFDPERGEKKGDSDEESESKESGDDREDGEDGEDSDSDSDFRENEAFSGPSDKDEQKPSGGSNNLKDMKKLARKGKRRRSSSNEESGSAQSSDSDDSEVSLFDEFKDGGAKLGRRDSLAEVSAADEDAMVIEGKRHRKALDYKKLHDVSLYQVHAHAMLYSLTIDEYALQNHGSELLCPMVSSASYM
jgi:hypothetical protein